MSNLKWNDVTLPILGCIFDYLHWTQIVHPLRQISHHWQRANYQCRTWQLGITLCLFPQCLDYRPLGLEVYTDDAGTDTTIQSRLSMIKRHRIRIRELHIEMDKIGLHFGSQTLLECYPLVRTITLFGSSLCMSKTDSDTLKGAFPLVQQWKWRDYCRGNNYQVYNFDLPLCSILLNDRTADYFQTLTSLSIVQDNLEELNLQICIPSYNNHITRQNAAALDWLDSLVRLPRLRSVRIWCNKRQEIGLTSQHHGQWTQLRQLTLQHIILCAPLLWTSLRQTLQELRLEATTLSEECLVTFCDLPVLQHLTLLGGLTATQWTQIIACTHIMWPLLQTLQLCHVNWLSIYPQLESAKFIACLRVVRVDTRYGYPEHRDYFQDEVDCNTDHRRAVLLRMLRLQHNHQFLNKYCTAIKQINTVRLLLTIECTNSRESHEYVDDPAF